MDPHLLRTFVTVARCGSFTAAARELRYTQSAVSQQIAALEEQLGTPLLARRPVTPTAAGARLLEHAAPILLRIDAARADVARLAGDPPGSLVVGASPLALTGPLAARLAGLRRRWPTLELTVRVLERAAVAAGVATGGLDLGLVDGIAAPSDPLRRTDAGPLRAIGFAERPLAVVMPSGHPLARRDGLRLLELADAVWVDAPEAAAPLPDLARAAGVDRLRASLRYDGCDLTGLLHLVGAGAGLAVVPSGTAPGVAAPGVAPPGQVCGVTLILPRLVHRIELVHGHLSSAPARAFAAGPGEASRPAG